MEFLNDLWGYFRVRKKLWLAPIILILVFCGLILIFGGATGLAPFIYPLFWFMNRVSDASRDIWIAGLSFVLLWLWSDVTVLIIIGAIYMIACYCFPILISLNHLLWSRLTIVLQTVFQPILFGFIYIVVLIPLGLLFQLFKKKDSLSNSSFMNLDKDINDQFFKEPW